MKIKTLQLAVAITVTILLSGTYAFAQETNWINPNTGVHSWNNAANWDDGIPTASKDAVIDGTWAAFTAISMDASTIFRDISLTHDSGSERLRLIFGNNSSGDTVTLNSTRTGTTNSIAEGYLGGGTVTLSGSLTLSSSAGATSTLTTTNGDTWNVEGGIFLEGNQAAARTSTITYGGVANSDVTFNGDVTFSNGSRFFSPADGATNATINFDGNLTLQAGTSTGAAPDFDIGRFNNTDAGLAVKVSDHLSVSAGQVRILKGKRMEVGSASFVSGGTLVLMSFGLTGDAVFKTEGDLTVNGGAINNTVNVAASTGGFLIEVGRDFVIGTNSTILLSSSADAITTMELSRNLDIQATSLASGNLNQLRLTLEGSDLQSLEVAVLDGNQTFGLHTLTFSLNTTQVTLVDNYLNVGAGEFFKTANLFNVGNTTLYLNDLQFFVGDNELTAGVYDVFGGELTVMAGAIPEPSTSFLLIGAVAAFLASRRRKLKQVG